MIQNVVMLNEEVDPHVLIARLQANQLHLSHGRDSFAVQEENARLRLELDEEGLTPTEMAEVAACHL